jgi:Skp family chaperone for outer membrane proteins
MKPNLVLALAAAVAVSAAVTIVHSQSAPAPTRLGFIDIRKAFEGYRKRQDILDQLKRKSEEFDLQLKQRVAQIQQESDKLATMNSGTDEYIELARRIKGEKAVFDVDKDYKARMLDAEQRRKNAAVYREISHECAAYGQEQGLAAVFMYLPPDTDFEQDLDMVVPTRAAIWRDDQLDVTKAVVERLNAQLPPPQNPSPAAKDPAGQKDPPSPAGDPKKSSPGDPK